MNIKNIFNKNIFLIISISCVSCFTFLNPAYATSALTVSVYPKEVDQLGKYVVTATNPDGTPFVGTIMTQYWVCPLGASSHSDAGCSAMPSNNFAIPTSGKAIQNLATYPNNSGSAIPVGKYFVLWKPSTGTYDWSNETVESVTPLDMTRYFNLTDGNYYRYNGNNLKMNQTVTDASRIDIKNETFCGENTNSMFFSKTSKYVYWSPSYGTNDVSNNITSSDFMVWRFRWSENGMLEAKTWSNYLQASLPADLNSFPASGFNFSNLRGQIYQRGIDRLTQAPISPYVYALSSLDLNKYSGPDGLSKWLVGDEVRFGSIAAQAGETESQYNSRFCSNAPVSALTASFVTMPIMKYYAKIIDTPAYKGPVAVVDMREFPKHRLGNINCNTIADFPNNCPEVLREDWFMAKDIGLVRMDVKNFGGVYDTPTSPACADDPDCQKDGTMTNPYLTQEITSYNVNYSQKDYLTITNQTLNSRTFNIHINRNNFSDLNFLSTLNQIQLVIDNDVNWTNGYGMEIMLHMRDNSQWKSANLVNGVYYVYETEKGGSDYGWQSVSTGSSYTNDALGFTVSVNGLLFDGEDLVVSISENDGQKGFNLTDKNMYLYFEGQDGTHGVIPLFAQGSESYQGYTLATIGKFTPIVGDLNGDLKVDASDYDLFKPDFSKIGNGLAADFNNNGRVDVFDYNMLVENFRK